MARNLKEELKELLKHKKSRSYYADKLGLHVFEVDKLLEKLKIEKENEGIEDNRKGIQSVDENKEKGTQEVKFLHTRQVLSEDEIWKECKMDRKKWKFVQVYHKKYGRGFLYTANFRLIPEDGKEKFQESFQTFLKTYKPSPKKAKVKKHSDKPDVAIILPKQDAHYNKWDVRGENEIEDRFGRISELTEDILKEVSATKNIDKVVYVVGSDQFNSEWTGMTTKGTPQTNILTYQEAFKQICTHEVDIIETLLSYSDEVDVVFIPGNHDEYVGWHLINWLECEFKGNKNISFESTPKNTKYLRYYNSAIMLNHGDDITPKDLAHIFPLGFTKDWTACDFYYIFSGDKHSELSLDLHGIKYFRVPQLSNAVSKWDDKKGYTCNKAEMNAFVISNNNGLYNIYKPIL